MHFRNSCDCTECNLLIEPMLRQILSVSAAAIFMWTEMHLEGAVIQSPDDAPPRPVNDDVTVVNMR